MIFNKWNCTRAYSMLTIAFSVVKLSRSSHKIEPTKYLSILSQDICWQPQVITISVKIISIRSSTVATEEFFHWLRRLQKPLNDPIIKRTFFELFHSIVTYYFSPNLKSGSSEYFFSNLPIFWISRRLCNSE